MIADLPTASFSLNLPTVARSSNSVGARVMDARYLPAKTVASYSGGGAPAPDAITAADLAPPSVQQFPAMVRQSAPAGMSTTTIAIIGGGVLLVGVAAFLAIGKG